MTEPHAPVDHAEHACTPWFEPAGVLARVLSDLISDELARLRPGGAPGTQALPPQPWPAELRLDQATLGLDSLELYALATALSEALHLHEGGHGEALLQQPRFGDWLAICRTALQGFDAQLTFRTSGSSGTPKSCTHELGWLAHEADHLAERLQATRRIQRVLSAVPAHHIYGFLFTVLLPQRLGSEVPVLDVRRHTPQGLARLLQPGDLLVSHPTHWALLAQHGGPLPAGVVGTSSTAPCPPELAQALLAQGLSRLVQVYGSSETAGIGWRDTPGGPYRLMAHWQGRLSADAEPATHLRRSAPGLPTQQHILQDRLSWLDARHFTLQGRLDQAVQVGGINVFPQRVQQVLCSHPDVAQAAVRLMAPHEGLRLKAFVVPAEGVDARTLPATLAQWVQGRLSAPEHPKAYTVGTALPLNALGKASDWPLA